MPKKNDKKEVKKEETLEIVERQAVIASEPEHKYLLSIDVLNAFRNATTVAEQMEIILKELLMQNYNSNPRTQVYADFIFGLLYFLTKQFPLQLAPLEALQLLQIGHELFLYTIQDPYPSVQETYAFYRRQMQNLACEIERFSASDIQSLVQFLTSTFFQHLKAFQYVYQHFRPCITQEISLVIETPLPTQSLKLARQCHESE